MKDQKPQDAEAPKPSPASGAEPGASQQSGNQSAAGEQRGSARAEHGPDDLESSKENDSKSRSRVRMGAGTADIQRSSATPQEGESADESMVNDPVGAFKERP